MLEIVLDTSPLQTGHAIRGVGTYTRLLAAELDKRSDVRLWTSTTDVVAGDGKPQLVHYPFFDLFFPTLPWRRSLPTVLTIHDVIPLVFPKFYRPGLRGRLTWWRQKWLARQVAAIITDSEASKNDIVKHLGIKAEKIHVVYLAGQPALTTATAETVTKVHRKYHLPAKYMLYVGDINYNKNLPQLIKSLKFLPEDTHLVCVGKEFYPHPIAEWQWLETQIALSNVGQRIHLLTDLGVDAASEVAALYTGAEVYVQPSLYEGFGLPVLEAMQCKVPVVCARNSSLIEVAGDAAVLVEPEAELIAAGVNEVLSWSDRERAGRVNRALSWAKQFSWERAAAETVAVYRSILEKPSHA